MENKKLFHFHLKDSMGNKKTLICRLKDGSINYSMYGGHGSSGMGFALSNIQFYDIRDGEMQWRRDRSLPVENLPGETEEAFKQRVLKMLHDSTDPVVGRVNPNVTFKK